MSFRQRDEWLRFRCRSCSFEVQVREGGNPYLYDWRGKRWYYAPDQLVQQVILEIEYERRTPLDDLELRRLLEKQGNAPEHLCLTCRRITWIDPARDPLECWWCASKQVVQGTLLEGQPCPKCGEGTFHREV